MLVNEDYSEKAYIYIYILLIKDINNKKTYINTTFNLYAKYDIHR